MAHSDRGHPSVRSPGPIVLICHKEKAGGVSPPRVPRGTPYLNTDEKKEVRRRESDDTNSNVSVGPPDPRPPDGRVGPPTFFHRKLREKMPWIQLLARDFVCRTECHSTSERGSRGEDETAVPCSTDPWSQPPNRTSLSTSFKIHSGVCRIYHKSTQRA